MKRKQRITATFTLAFALISSASAVEYVVTKSDGVLTTGYPFEPRADDMVEILHKGRDVGLIVTFSDGATINATARSLTSINLIGVTSVVPSVAAEHAVLWKVTPRGEYAKDGATYAQLRSDMESIDFPTDSIVTLIAHKPADNPSGLGIRYSFSDSALNGQRQLEGLLGVGIPLVTQISSANFYPLFEISSATATAPALAVATVNGISGTNFVMRWDSVADASYQVQCSADLSSWENIGVPISGTGAPMSWSAAAVDADGKFYRVVSK